jgi:uncharacterized protein (TIGR00369 family)
MAALASARNKERMGVDYFGMEVPFLDHLGIIHEKIDDDRVRVTLELREEMLNSFDVAHGGIVMTLLDVAMAMAARVKLNHRDGIMTIDMSTSFIRSAKEKIIVEGKVLQTGKSIQFCEANAYDGTGQIVAKAIGSFKLHTKVRQNDSSQ